MGLNALTALLAMAALVVVAVGAETQQQQHGGWFTLPEPKIECALPIFTGYETGGSGEQILTKQLFLDEYHLKRPFLLRGGASHWGASAKWTRSQFEADHGDVVVKKGFSSRIVSNFGDGTDTATLKDFLQNLTATRAEVLNSNDESPYVFDRENFMKSPGIQGLIETPAFFGLDGANKQTELYFLLGGLNSGIPMHAHTDGWNGLVFGRKHWFLYSPKTLPPLVYPVYRGQQHWKTVVYPQILADPKKPKPIECIQESGDILYIPESWFHATVNLGETIAVAEQRVLPRLPFLQHYQAGQAKRAQGKLFAAIESLTLALRSTSTLGFEVQNELGLTFQETKQFVQAHHAYDEAIRHNPHFAEAHYNKARLLKQEGKLKDARNLFKKAIEIDDSNPDHYSMLGNTQAEMNKTEAALRSYRRALELDPSSAEVHRSLGNLMRVRDPAEAQRLLEKSLALRPKSIAAMNDYGSILAQNGKLEDAKKWFQSALREMDRLVEVEGTPRSEDADKKLRSSIYVNLGSLLSLLRERKEAMGYFRLALELDRSDKTLERALDVLAHSLEQYPEMGSPATEKTAEPKREPEPEPVPEPEPERPKPTRRNDKGKGKEKKREPWEDLLDSLGGNIREINQEL